MLRFVLVLSLCVFALSDKHTFGVRDMVQMERVQSPVLSPDGQWLVFPTLQVGAAPDYKTTTSLRYMEVTDTQSNSLELTNPGVGGVDTNPVWTKDGKYVLFLSSRSGTMNVWAVEVATKTVKQVSTYPLDLDNFKIADDGTMISFVVEVYPGLSMQQTIDKDKQKADTKSSGRVFDELFVRHWDSWFEGKYRHIFVAALAQDQFTFTLGDAVDTMLNTAGDCPSRPFGGSEEYALHPAGNELAYTVKLTVHDGVHDQAWSTNQDLYLVPLTRAGQVITAGEAKCITCDNKAYDGAPVYSPTGDRIAFISQFVQQYESDRFRARVWYRQDSSIRTLTEDWDRSVIGVQFWAPADLDPQSEEALYVKAYDGEYTKLFRVSLKGVVTLALHYHGLISVAISKSTKRFVFDASSITFPTDIFTASLKNDDVVQLTNRNKDLMAQFDLVTPDSIHFLGDETAGDQVQAWLLKPAGFDQTKKYPLVLYIHGGPEGGWHDDWSYRWNPQAIAAQGFGVLAINPHGSTGWGHKFQRGVLRSWGGVPFNDLMRGVDYVLATYSWTDGNKLTAMGASYGGYMINWINTQTTRFKALVCHDGVFNFIMMYYATEELWFPETEWGLPPYLDRTDYKKYSPSEFVSTMNTPQLIVHGGHDYRIPDTQALGAFTALQRRGIPSKLLHFPEETHFVLKRQNSILWHDTVIAWLKQWTA